MYKESIEAFHSGFHEQCFHHKGSHSFLPPFLQKSVESKFEVNFFGDSVLQQAKKLGIIAYIKPLLQLFSLAFVPQFGLRVFPPLVEHASLQGVKEPKVHLFIMGADRVVVLLFQAFEALHLLPFLLSPYLVLFMEVDCPPNSKGQSCVMQEALMIDPAEVLLYFIVL